MKRIYEMYTCWFAGIFPRWCWLRKAGTGKCVEHHGGYWHVGSDPFRSLLLLSSMLQGGRLLKDVFSRLLCQLATSWVQPMGVICGLEAREKPGYPPQAASLGVLFLHGSGQLCHAAMSTRSPQLLGWDTITSFFCTSSLGLVAVTYSCESLSWLTVPCLVS